MVSPVATEKGELQQSQLYDCRDAYARTLEEMAEQDARVCVAINDSLSSAKMKVFKSKFPSRFVNVGIAEQNMIGVAMASQMVAWFLPMRRIVFPDSPGNGAGEGRSCIFEGERTHLRDVVWYGVRSAHSRNGTRG